MPKIGKMPDEQREIADELRDQYGNMLMLKDIMDYMGIGHYNTIHKLVDGIPTVMKKYNARDVAKRIYEVRT